ncbi:MAG: GNAT family N-acetyltransferase [Clostridia bacterium]|nr:GNAT family N-acetyltransferase [Clostridia bacterium]
MNMPLLYRAALQASFGKRIEFSRSSITDALFVYLEGEPEPESIARVDSHFRVRPLVCLSDAWEEQIKTQYPDAAIYRRTMMKPACSFIIPDNTELPAGYRLTDMDETAFDQHPFSHGENYSGWAAFQADGSGAVVYHGREIVAAASSFLSVGNEVELDVSTREDHRGRKLAAACVARMLQDCMKRGITVHWDAQNDVSRYLAEKFGFEAEQEYSVYWLPGS